MNSPAHDLALYLETQSVGTFGGSSGWSINVSREPELPDTAITLYDTGGPGPTDDDQDQWESTVQVRVRSRDYAAAFAKHEAIRDLFVLPAPIIGETTRFSGITMTSDILALGRDDNDRHLLTANYQVLRSAIGV